MTSSMTTTFFKQNPDIVRPYTLMDLDDTLFQTQRKIDAWQVPTAEPEHLVCATVNKQGEPLSFMSQRQASFFNWLLASTELIVVTARDTAEIKRVKLPFDSWQVLTHGAVIVRPDGSLLSEWQQHSQSQLIPLQDKMHLLTERLKQYSDQDLVLTPHSDTFDGSSLTIYVAVKHANKDHQALADLAQQLPTLIHDFAAEFYVPVNAHNLAQLPHALH